MRDVIRRVKWLWIYTMASGLLLTSAPRAFAQAHKSESVVQKAIEQFESLPLQTTKLDSQIFLFTGDGGDVVAIVDEGSTLLIDSGIDSRAQELNDAVYRATLRPITQLINTHWHFDHTGGNLFFGSTGVKIIAHDNVKVSLSSVRDVPLIGFHDGPYPSFALPTQTYSESMVLRQGSEELRLVHCGSAHTDGDTVVYLSRANVIVIGDIFSNPFYPIIDLSSGGSIDGLIRAVDDILEHSDDQTKIVPGHGHVATRVDLHSYREMLVQVRQRVEALITSGRTIDQVQAAAPTAEFDETWGKGYVSGSVFVEMVYESLKAKTAQ